MSIKVRLDIGLTVQQLIFEETGKLIPVEELMRYCETNRGYCDGCEDCEGEE